MSELLKYFFTDRSLTSAKIYLLCILAALTACVPPESGQQQANNAAAPIAETSTPTPAPTPLIAEGEPEFDAEKWLTERVEDKSLHTALVASLEPSRTLVRHNIDKTFNPASLVKLATTLAALKKLGAEHRFTVQVFADGKLGDKQVLEGDFYFAGSVPTFNETTAGVVADELEKRGIRGVTGKLCVSPNFSFNFSESAERSAELLVNHLNLNPKPKTCVSEQPTGAEIFVLQSHPLREVLLYQNTHSSNFVAHRVGDAVGGAEGVRQFLIDELGLPPDEVKLDTTSGLKENAMTARGVFKVLRELDAELKRQNLQPVDVLPRASENVSTLDKRLTESEFERAVVGKTGTLSALDGGVGMASLAGLIYTKDAGTFAFVLMNQGREVMRHRDLQDRLLREVLHKRVEPQEMEINGARDLLAKSDLRIEGRGNLAKKESK